MTEVDRPKSIGRSNGVSRFLTVRGQVETAWETYPPSGRPARHQCRLSKAGVAFAEVLRRPAGTEVSRARSAGSRRPALGEAV